ncbi:cytochrome c [Segetibacter aerophilus]|nr:cytochrome c [Segetibacter aerophilus]
MKKILKWTVLIILTIVGGIAIVTATSQHKKFTAPYPAIKATIDMAVIARGKHLVFDIAHCADCHSKANVDSLMQLGQDVPLSGGKLFALPLGNIYTKNITPDKETGIGKFTDAEIARILRYGVHRDGTAVFDFMPFHNISDEDMTAIISFLRTQKPVRNEVPKHELNAIGKVVNAFMVKPVGPSEDVPQKVTADTTAAYGRYLVHNLANCGGCHTKRDIKGKPIGEPFAGGSPIKKDGYPALTPPNLTPHPSSRIYGWTQDMFIKRFRMGEVTPHSEMPWNTFKRMKDDELKAIYKYLKTVKPAKTTAVEKTEA